MLIALLLLAAAYLFFFAGTMQDRTWFMQCVRILPATLTALFPSSSGATTRGGRVPHTADVRDAGTRNGCHAPLPRAPKLSVFAAPHTPVSPGKRHLHGLNDCCGISRPLAPILGSLLRRVAALSTIHSPDKR